MDRAPYLIGGGRWGYELGDAQIYDSMLRDGLNDAFSGRHSGWHTEDLAKSRQITREDQDRWAERSRTTLRSRTGRGQVHGRDGLTHRVLRAAEQPGIFQKDEHNRPDTTLAEPR